MSNTRREFLKQASVAAAAGAMDAHSSAAERPQAAPQPLAWYRRTYRWGQTNITEADPARYDIGWWRRYWKRTRTQGVIINAGGIVAYYPSRFPLQYRAAGLGGRDLYGELARAAHEDGLAVLARMDSSRAHEPFYRAHPDWFTVDASGKPFRAGELYVACINGPYYAQFIPDVLREIIGRSHPQGITDNSWSGLDRGSICHCRNCRDLFARRTGKPLPAAHDWDDPIYRQWIEWNYARRLEIWDANNRVTRGAGGPDCLWIGMVGGGVSGQSRSFRDVAQICSRTPILMLDHQARSDTEGFGNNPLTGKLLHGLLGWEKLIPESMAMYQAGGPTFRLSAKPAAEARMWMLAGFAGGIQPWWHHVGAYQEDRRAYRTAAPVLRWHEANERYLLHRTPLATVGVVWSQRNTDFFGRDDAETRVDQPFRGFTQALVRARIPFLPVNAAHVERDGGGLAVLVLPNLAAMSDQEVAAVRRFVERGGSLIATGRTSLFDARGDPRPDFALADLMGVTGGKPGRGRAGQTHHTYLRLAPELRGQVDGPRAGDEPPAVGQRHPVLAGFDETDLLPFGGELDPMSVAAGATVPLTYVPPSPIYPPEMAYLRQPRTNVPGLVLSDAAGPGRVAFLPADIERRFAADNLPDHGNLLANLVRWAARGTLPLAVEGPGLLDFELYQQPGRVICHVLNLTSAATWRPPLDELIPVGPLRIKVRLPQGVKPGTARTLVAGASAPAAIDDGWAVIELKAVRDHELIVWE